MFVSNHAPCAWPELSGTVVAEEKVVERDEDGVVVTVTEDLPREGSQGDSVKTAVLRSFVSFTLCLRWGLGHVHASLVRSLALYY